MRRIWQIFRHEYVTHVTRRSYLLFTFGFPLFMVGLPLLGFIILALALYAILPPTDPRPIGLVDQAGLSGQAVAYPDTPVSVLPFAGPEEAAAALASGRVQAYYEIQPDYWQTGAVSLTYDVAPSEPVRDMFNGWLRERVRSEIPPQVLARLDHGPNIVHRDAGGGRIFSFTDVLRAVLIFFLIYFGRMAGSFTAEYMFGSVASEADNRTLEILVSSVSPRQFMAGKLLGLLAVGLTQLGMWAGAALALGLGLSALLKVDLLGPLLTWAHLGLAVSIFLAAYVMDQMLAATLGLLRVSGGAGNLLFGLLNSVVGLGLLYTAYFVPRSPHTPLAVAASLFPVTAPLVLLIRLVVTEVPAWQIVLSQLLLWGTNLASLLWLHRLLQANLVAYTPPFSLRRWLGRQRWAGAGGGPHV